MPSWLADRMTRLGAVIAEAIVHHYGRDELLRRLAHPLWFQSFGAVMGMDWHSSGITTSVIGALKRGLEPLSGDLGIHVCGGRGKQSRKTPFELSAVGERVGIDGAALADVSRLVAKVDSAAVQDGFDLYLHGFIVTDDGHWAVVQQGMNDASRIARRYHWLSEGITSFVDEPHAAIEGVHQGEIVNLTDRRADASRRTQLELLSSLGPDGLARKLAVIEAKPRRPRPIPSSSPCPISSCPRSRCARQRCSQPPPACELHRGAQSRAGRFRRIASRSQRRRPDGASARDGSRSGARRALSFHRSGALLVRHGGKDRHPFPAPLKGYDETIRVMKTAVQKAKLGQDDRLAALEPLDDEARRVEKSGAGPPVADLIAEERRLSHSYGGRSVFGREPAPEALDEPKPRLTSAERQINRLV